MAISFFDSPRQFPSKKYLKAAIQQMAKAAGYKTGDLHYIFVSDDALLEINRTHLQHDYYTDIITFDLSEDPLVVEGDIYISTDRVQENATTFGSGTEEEFVRVVGHGFLHLIGYHDKTDAQATEMRKAEANFISCFKSLKDQ